MSNGILNLGCASNIIDVPLFTELYGYGPFLGRRNRGVRDPLYCRVASFSDGNKRLIFIANDLVTMDADAAWEIRGELVKRLKIDSSGIMVSGSHTHSGPTVSPGIGWGELDLNFRNNWIKTAIDTAVKAVSDESKVILKAGKSVLKKTLGYNRVQKDGPTDPDIRWIKCLPPDGTVKLLIHNHGMHGVVFGKEMLLVSADWIGAANKLILDKKLAENVLFLYGAAGNINTNPCCLNLEKGETELKRISESYTDDLKNGLSNETEISSCPMNAVIKQVKLPCEDYAPDKISGIIDVLRKTNTRLYMLQRLEEMLLYVKAGNKLDVVADLQVLRMGDLYFYAFPGEPFTELAREIEKRSPGKFPVSIAVANGNCRYFPTRKTFDENSDITQPKTGFGFYEIYQGCGRFMPPYKPDIAEFLIDKFMEIAAKL